MNEKSIPELDRRFSAQAEWTKDFRNFLFRKFPFDRKLAILEVGCGTGAVLRKIEEVFEPRIECLIGIDPDFDRLEYARQNSGKGIVCKGYGEKLPFPDSIFDLVYCHYLLMWVSDPSFVLAEMKRVAKENGIIAVMAEPCYDRMDVEPKELLDKVQMQAEKLKNMGANINCGSHLEEYFCNAGFDVVNIGTYENNNQDKGFLQAEIEQMKQDIEVNDMVLDRNQKIVYNIPTRFAYI